MTQLDSVPGTKSCSVYSAILEKSKTNSSRKLFYTFTKLSHDDIELPKPYRLNEDFRRITCSILSILLIRMTDAKLKNWRP